ncbi:hypothetical protein JCM19237_5821 [Photobacterium aphoticum]|uniref:Uncharacterized protein n=1 Tax=Photobacterium aphoticum TaxID=754436 RepID=A0A090QL03_9GAMM|nr:hypothetical protein JCM19237_5821 [Photobacterium aphoticum]
MKKIYAIVMALTCSLLLSSCASYSVTEQDMQQYLDKKVALSVLSVSKVSLMPM